jgi:hypothetical protein
MCAALVSSLLALSIAFAAGAEESAPDSGGIEPVRIRFDGPRSCVDSAGFLNTVLRRTPRARPAKADERARVFRVSISQAQGGGMRGEVVVEETLTRASHEPCAPGRASRWSMRSR